MSFFTYVILSAICIIKCNGCFLIQNSPCSTSCSDSMNMCYFSCNTYHCTSASMCNSFMLETNLTTLDNLDTETNVSENLKKVVTGIHNTCKIFAQKDWDCGDLDTSPICLSCNSYLTTYYTCANECNNTCYTDPICTKVKQLYSLVNIDDYQSPKDYKVIKNIAITIMNYCSDGYSLTYGFSSFLIFFSIILIK